MDLELHGKTAVVTGGSAGIGLAIARALAGEGVRVALCARNQQRATKAANAIREERGVDAKAYRCDVTDPDQIGTTAVSISQDFGDVDILINNAGEGTREDVLEADDARWQYYWELHVMAAVRLSRALVPGMRRKGGGVILNNASICAKQPLHYEPIYNVTKAALVMLSKCLAEDLIADGIRVNCINPGLILTEAWEEAARDAVDDTDRSWTDYLDDVARQNTPIGRFATPEELADFFVFLCSARAAYCVGSTYYVDGGWLKVVT